MRLGPTVATLASRRARVMDAMDGGVLLLAAAPERVRTADLLYPYRQDSDFDYLTGFPEADAVCLLQPGHEHPFAMFVQPEDKERTIWVGARYGLDGARTHFGADAVFPIADLETELAKRLAVAAHVYLPLGRNDALVERLHMIVRKVQRDRPRTGTGPTALREATEILHEQRVRKASDELDALRDAIAIAGEAHREAMRTARPGMYEYELEAGLNFTFRRRGAAGPAYESIVASGAGATILHYTQNDRALGTDELLLIDAGAEYGGYCSDITRTFSTGRRFTLAQRAVYDAVLAAQLAAINSIAPGTTIEAIHAAALRVLSEALTHMGLLTGSVDEIIEKETYRRFYMHRTSHWLGRDVHDVGQYKVDGTPRPLEPGMVFTVEPGLYIAADADDLPAEFRGLGVRIEDDVLVTATGVEVLSAAIPKHVTELDALRDEALASS
jgi:Xaa-Pro aminopeptidase